MALVYISHVCMPHAPLNFRIFTNVPSGFLRHWIQVKYNKKNEAEKTIIRYFHNSNHTCDSFEWHGSFITTICWICRSVFVDKYSDEQHKRFVLLQTWRVLLPIIKYLDKETWPYYWLLNTISSSSSLTNLLLLFILLHS